MGEVPTSPPGPWWPALSQARTRELETLQQTVEELQAQVHSMDGAKGWFERRLKEAEVSWCLWMLRGLLRGYPWQTKGPGVVRPWKFLTRRRYNNYKYICTQHGSTAICKTNANKYERRN